MYNPPSNNTDITLDILQLHNTRIIFATVHSFHFSIFMGQYPSTPLITFKRSDVDSASLSVLLGVCVVFWRGLF